MSSNSTVLNTHAKSKLRLRKRRHGITKNRLLYRGGVVDWSIDQLAKDVPLPTNWKDHQLKGDMKRFRECHIGGAGDWLLVYEKRETDMILYLIGTGSHTGLLG